MRKLGLYIVVAVGLSGLAATEARSADDLSPAAKAEQGAASSIQAPTTTQATAPPASVTVMEPAEAHGVLGRDVRSAKDEDMGHVVDVLVDRNGVVRAAVIDFGGFLGVGSRKIVVDWSALHFEQMANKNGSITLDLNKEQVMAAPEYKEDKPIIMLGASGSLNPFQYGR